MVMRLFDEAMVAMDAAAAAALAAEDIELSDHRLLGWEPVQGRAALETLYQTMFDGLQSLEFHSEIIEADGNTALLHQVASFRAVAEDGGGDGEVSMNTRVTVRDGLVTKTEILEPA